jgi:hypothetical protein
MAAAKNQDMNVILMQQTIGELKEANKNIATSMNSIADNLKTLNDHNILHMTKNDEQHKSIEDKINLMMKNYWWVIIALGVVLLLVLGYKEIIKFLPWAPQ